MMQSLKWYFQILLTMIFAPFALREEAKVGGPLGLLAGIGQLAGILAWVGVALVAYCTGQPVDTLLGYIWVCALVSVFTFIVCPDGWF